jgi:hypothetical protein
MEPKQVFRWAVALVLAAVPLALTAHRAVPWALLLPIFLPVAAVCVLRLMIGIGGDPRRSWRQRLTLPTVALLMLPAFWTTGRLAREWGFDLWRRARHEAVVRMILRGELRPESTTGRYPVPDDLRAGEVAVLRRDVDGPGVRIEFFWSSVVFKHTAYVYCEGNGCGQGLGWRSHRRLAENWFYVSD